MGELNVGKPRKRRLSVWLLGIFSGLLLLPLLLFFLSYIFLYSDEIRETRQAQTDYGQRVFEGYLEDTQLSLMIAQRLIERSLPAVNSPKQIQVWVDQQVSLGVDQIIGITNGGEVTFIFPSGKNALLEGRHIPDSLRGFPLRTNNQLFHHGAHLIMARLIHPGSSGELLWLLKRVPLENWRFIQDSFRIDYQIFNRDLGRVVLSNLPEEFIPESINFSQVEISERRGIFSLEPFGGPSLLVGTSLGADSSGAVLGQLERMALLYFFGFFILVGIVYLIIQSRLISRISAVSKAAQGLQGNFEVNEYQPIDPGVNDEMGRMVQVFNSMARTLNRYTRNLQDLVNERTQELERTQQAQRNFFTNLSHEIRIPLHTIIGYSDILQDEVSFPEKEYISVIHAKSIQLERLIEQFMDVSRLESGLDRVRLQAFSLAEVLGQQISNWNAIASNLNVTLISQISPHLPDFLRGDEVRVLFILNNLVEYTLETSEGREVRFSVSVEEQYDAYLHVGVSIISQGPISYGDASKNDRISAGKKEPLKIALARRLLQILGGVLSIQEDEQGSTVAISFPFMVEDQRVIGGFPRGEITVPGTGNDQPQSPSIYLCGCTPAQDSLAEEVLDSVAINVEIFHEDTDLLANLRFNHDVRPSLLLIGDQDLSLPVNSIYSVTRKTLGRNFPILFSLPRSSVLQILDSDPYTDILPLPWTAKSLVDALVRLQVL